MPPPPPPAHCARRPRVFLGVELGKRVARLVRRRNLQHRDSGHVLGGVHGDFLGRGNRKCVVRKNQAPQQFATAPCLPLWWQSTNVPSPSMLPPPKGGGGGGAATCSAPPSPNPSSPPPCSPPMSPIGVCLRLHPPVFLSPLRPLVSAPFASTTFTYFSPTRLACFHAPPRALPLAVALRCRLLPWRLWGPHLHLLDALAAGEPPRVGQVVGASAVGEAVQPCPMGPLLLLDATLIVQLQVPSGGRPGYRVVLSGERALSSQLRCIGYQERTSLAGVHQRRPLMRLLRNSRPHATM